MRLGRFRLTIECPSEFDAKALNNHLFKLERSAKTGGGSSSFNVVKTVAKNRDQDYDEGETIWNVEVRSTNPLVIREIVDKFTV